MSIQDIRQNPQDTSNFYLANIYQAIADPNRPNISSSLPASPPPFTPPAYAVWVNSLWFLSLVISITCALLATFLQQWTRRYLKVTQTRYSLHKRARIRSFFAEGVEKSTLPLVVEALPMLLHVSLSLFFAGLVVFLWNVNLTIFKVVLSWISVCTALYGCFTLIPVFRHDSPYYTPITEFAGLVMSLILLGFFILCVVLDFLFFLCSCCFCCRAPARIFGYLTNWFNQVLDMTLLTPKKAALKVSSEIDTRALMWTFDRLDEDHELELFFSGLPGFHNSKVVKEPLHGLSSSQQLELLTGLIGLLDRTYSSNLLADGVKRHREDICTNAINLVHAPKALPNILRRLASEDEYGPVQSTEIVHFVRRWGNRNEYTTLDQAIFSVIVARVQQHDNSWFNLASHELGVTEPVLRKHATHRDTLSLTILIYVIRQQLIHFRNPSWPSDAIAEVIRTASKFKVQDTSPELQHELCALWNQIVRKAQNDGDWKITKCILNPIRKVYISLHQDSESSPIRFSASAGDGDPVLDNPSSYPVCNIAGHILDESASTTFSRNVLRDDAALSPASPPSPDTPSLSVPAPLHVDKSLTTVPPLDDSHPTQQTVDSLRAPVTTPDPASAEAVQDIVDTGITSPTPEAYTFAPPLSSTSPSAAVSLLNNSDPLMPSDSPNLPSFASDPVLEDTLPTGLSLSFKFAHDSCGLS